LGGREKGDLGFLVRRFWAFFKEIIFFGMPLRRSSSLNLTLPFFLKQKIFLRKQGQGSVTPRFSLLWGKIHFGFWFRGGRKRKL